MFRERQVYRIDHYLGKETVQNLLVLRFANTIFEPIWNRNYIDHVQITVAEEVDVGRRAGYYDSAGVVRDMFQNHLLQLVMVTAMEAPVRYEADADPRREGEGAAGGPAADAASRCHATRSAASIAATRRPKACRPGSRTATFAAVKLWIDNWRWQGVPFYLRSGKAMSCRTTQIVVQFREPPHMLFADGPRSAAESNRLVIQVQPAEGIQLHFETKVPDAGMKLRQTDLELQLPARVPRRDARGLRAAAARRAARATPACSPGPTKSKRPGRSATRSWPSGKRSDKPTLLHLRAGLLGPDRVHRVDGRPRPRSGSTRARVLH